MVDKHETKEPIGEIYNFKLPLKQLTSAHNNYQKNYIAPCLASQHVVYQFVGSGTGMSSQNREDQKESMYISQKDESPNQ